MGTYTTYFKFYKPGPTELVDAETDVAQNLRTFDKLAKGMFEYQNTDVSSISSLIPLEDKQSGARYYKTYSNSIYFINDDLNTEQDPVTNADFIDLSSYLINGFNPIPGGYVAYKLTGNSGTLSQLCELEGEIRLNIYDAMTVNTTYTVATLPSPVWPSVGHYFDLSAGNTGLNYSMGRMLINTNGNMTWTRYGDTITAGSTENKISLSGIRFWLGTTP
jgi:hypothetical protein